MPSLNTGFAVNVGLSPNMKAGFGDGASTPSAGNLLQEDGTSFFLLEDNSGIIILEATA